MSILSIARNALRRLFRDRSNIFFVFLLPIALVLLIGAQFGGGFTPTVGVTAPAGDPLSDQLVSELADLYEIDEYESREELVLAVERGWVESGIEVPAGFTESVTARERPQIGYLSQPDTSGQGVQTAVAATLERILAPITAASVVAETQGIPLEQAEVIVEGVAGSVPPVEVSTRTTGEALFPNLGQFDLGASSQLVLFMFLTGLTGSAALIQSRQLGVTRRMLSTPASTRTILTGEALGRLGVTLFQGVYIVAVTLIVFRVNWGNPIGAAAIMLVFGMVAAAAAMLLGSVFSNDQQAGGISVVLGLGLAALGGSMVPVEIFSSTMQSISMITPHYWANDAFAELVRRDGTIADILPQLGVMAGFAVVLMALATWRLQRVITR
ncbi:MAG: ABC transporter permease [Acidimicrobiia bacterium]|nr:ABC transporter permease [Acidimicrobiia bacterium]